LPGDQANENRLAFVVPVTCLLTILGVDGRLTWRFPMVTSSDGRAGGKLTPFKVLFRIVGVLLLAVGFALWIA
jgi:hypothetical protein